MAALLGTFHRPAGQGGSANFGLRIGAADSARAGLVKFAVSLEAADYSDIRLLMTEGLRIQVSKLLGARVVRPRFESARVHLVPNLLKRDAFVARETVLGGLKAELLPGA